MEIPKAPKETISPKEVRKEIDTSLTEMLTRVFGNPIIFTSAPTNAQMRANSWGIFNLDLYVKFANNVTLKFTGVNVA